MGREDFIPKPGGKGNMLLSPQTLAAIQELAARPEVEMDASQFVSEKRGKKVHFRFRENILPPPRPDGMPEGFQLSRSDTGPRIHKGRLDYSITTLYYEQEDGKNHLTGQDEIPGVESLSILTEEQEEESDWLDLDWWGDVYLQWTVDPETCIPIAASIVGPSTPTVVPVPRLDQDLTREIASGGGGCGYYVKIGTVPEDGKIIQERTGNVTWDVTFIPENPVSGSSSESSSGASSESSSESSSGSSSASSSAGSGSGDSGGGGGSGSDKSSNAIVPAPWNREGFCALATVESNQVWFEFVLKARLTGRKTVLAIDPRWLHLCEPGSLCVAAAPNGDRPFPVSAQVVMGKLVLRAWPLLRPREVTLKISGIRKGFAEWNMPPRTMKQFEANERSLQAMYPR